MTYRQGMMGYSFAGAGRSAGATWNDLTGKPDTFPPSAHSHDIANITGLTDALAGSSDPWTYVKLDADATTTTTANSNTALAFTPPPLSVVIFEGQLFLQAAATTTGARPGLKWPTLGVLQNIARVESARSATASVLRFWGNTTTANAAATSVAVANEGLFGQIQGTIVTGPVVTGDLIITLASEVAGSEARIMANSWLRYRVI